MNLGQILLEIKKLNIYSPVEWEEYLSYFDNNRKLLQYIKDNNSKDISGIFIETIKGGQGSSLIKPNIKISSKIISVNYLSDPKVRSSITLGVVSGSYDLLHIGHIRGFVFGQQYLIQFLNPKLCALILSDESIRAKKGPSRPILNINDRLRMLSSLQCIDYIIPLEDPNCLNVLEEIKPDFFFKADTDIVQEIVRIEMSFVESYGGNIVTFPSSKSVSSTKLIEIVRMR